MRLKKEIVEMAASAKQKRLIRELEASALEAGAELEANLVEAEAAICGLTEEEQAPIRAKIATRRADIAKGYTLLAEARALVDTEATMNHTEEEQEVIALSEGIEADLIQVLERHSLLHPEAPVFCRRLALHSVIDLAGKLMAATLTLEGEDVRPTLAAMIKHLALFVAPASRSH